MKLFISYDNLRNIFQLTNILLFISVTPGIDCFTYWTTSTQRNNGAI